MRRPVLFLAIALVAGGLAAPAFAITVSTPAGLPVSVTVHADPVVTAPDDPLAGGEINVDPGASVEVCCLPPEVNDLLVPEAEEPGDDDPAKAKKEKKDKDKPSARAAG